MKGKKRFIVDNYYKIKSIYNYLESTNIFVVDWDICIILDACRYDMFKKVNNIEGKLHKIKSVGSSTKEWRDNTFNKWNEPNYNDIIYINSNPYMREIEPLVLKMSNLWKNQWNNTFNTVMPQTVIEETEKHLQYNSKIVMHFLQPHYPPIKTNNLLDYKEYCGGFDSILNHKINRSIWDYLNESHDKKVSINLQKDMELTLRYTMNIIKKFLLKHKDKKIIITSDHGNMFGERCLGLFPFYGHIKKFYHSKLVEVPYFIVA